MTSTTARTEQRPGSGSRDRQERALRVWLERRDDRSLAEACEAWDRYAQHYAHLYRRKLSAEYDDCIQVARVGLIKALQRFDASRGNRFTTYATWVIRGEFTVFSRDCLTVIAIPEWLQALRTRINLAGDDDPVRLAQRLGVSVANVELAQRIHEVANPASLSAFHRGSEQWEFAASDPEIDDLAESRAEEARSILEKILPLLPERQRKALWLRIGMGMPLREAGQALGVSYETVAKDQKKALSRLQITIARMGQGAFGA